MEEFHEMYDLIVGIKLQLFSLEKKLVTMNIKEGNLVSSQHNTELEKDILAFVIGINELYQKKLFKPVAATDCH